MTHCRLCGHRAEEAFRAILLQKREVAYYRCSHCGSLQTEEPSWLDEAYSVPTPHPLDAGAGKRVMTNVASVSLVGRFFNAKRVLDFGGGDGLLCRLLRDHGVDAYTFDEYSNSSYGGIFTAPLSPDFDMVTAFEVFEHLPDPRTTLCRVLSHRPERLLFSTMLYSGQGPEWWYLSRDAGQHVFFYTAEGLADFARSQGYHFYRLGQLHLFSCTPISPMRLRILRGLMRRPLINLYRASLALSDDWSPIERDYQSTLARLRHVPSP